MGFLVGLMPGKSVPGKSVAFSSRLPFRTQNVLSFHDIGLVTDAGACRPCRQSKGNKKRRPDGPPFSIDIALDRQLRQRFTLLLLSGLRGVHGSRCLEATESSLRTSIRRANRWSTDKSRHVVSCRAKSMWN